MIFFQAHPNENMKHHPVVDWVTAERKARGCRPLQDVPLQDVPRTVRGLYGEGILIKVKRGRYKYDPDYEQKREQENFSEKRKQEIF